MRRLSRFRNPNPGRIYLPTSTLPRTVYTYTTTSLYSVSPHQVLDTPSSVYPTRFRHHDHSDIYIAKRLQSHHIILEHRKAYFAFA